MQVQKQLVQGLSTIDGCGLPGRYKIWCYQFGLLPHVLWPLQIYEIALTREERNGEDGKFIHAEMVGFAKNVG